MLCLGLLGATEKPRVTLMTALPLMWGEGSLQDIVAGRTGASPVLAGLQVMPVDTITAQTLGRNVLILAQPRRLSPQELVALDQWVRKGGRAIIFADPALRWKSRYILGDARRPPPVTLLDPLLAHWGLTLGEADGMRTSRTVLGRTMVTVDAGHWRGGKTCSPQGSVMIRCIIGRGKALLIGDADLLSEPDAGAPFVNAAIDSLSGDGKDVSQDTRPLLLFGAGGVLLAALCLTQIKNRVRKKSEQQ